MITMEDIFGAGIDIQTAVHYCYFNSETYERVELTYQQVKDKEIVYIYVEDNEIYIEYNEEDFVETEENLCTI